MTMKLSALLCVLLISPLLMSTRNVSRSVEHNTNGTIVGKQTQSIVEDGLIVETQSSWATNSNTYFEVDLDTPYNLKSGDYLAIDFEVTKHTYDYFICRFGVNGILFAVDADLESEQNNNTFHALSNGNMTTVTQKYGYFFFFNASFTLGT